MKIFITGHKGLLGKKLISVLKDKNYDIILGDDVDVTKPSTFEKYIDSSTTVIHCAAKTNVDWCELNKYDAWNVNVDGTANVAMICKKVGAKMVLMSSDYVVKVTNFYAQTKLVAEEIAKKYLDDLLIIRTSTLYGYNGEKNDRATFVTWVISQKENIKTVTDNITHPTLIDDIATNIDKLLRDDRKGIVNVVGKDCISKYTFANLIINVFELKIKNEKIWSGQLKNWVAKRPNEIRLENGLDVVTYTALDGLKLMKKQMEEDLCQM